MLGVESVVGPGGCPNSVAEFAGQWRRSGKRLVIISGSRRLIFVHIPKTAGDSITASIKPVLSKSDFVVQNDFQDWRRRVNRASEFHAQRLAKHTPAMGIRSEVGESVWRDCFKFAVVRHPFTRAQSLYSYLALKYAQREGVHWRNAWYLTSPGRPGDPRHWPAMMAYTSTRSFAEFIRHPYTAMDLAMRPQCDFVCNASGEIIVDVVGRFEHLNEDMKEIFEAARLPGLALLRKNESVRVPSNRVALDRDDIELLTEMFERDLVEFGYDVEW